MPTPSQQQRDFSIATDLEDALILRGFTYSDRFNELFTLTVDVEAVKPAIDLRKLLGTNATLRIEDFDASFKRYINGMVVRVSQTALKGNQRTYQLTIAPTLWKLTRRVDCRIYQEKDVPAIIKEVLQRAGITDTEFLLRDSHATWDYCVQYRESDLAFITRLMEQEGIFYFFKHDNGRNTLVFVDNVGALSKLAPADTIAYEPLDAGTADEDGITDWRLDSDIEPEKVTLGDYNFEKPNQQTEGTSKLVIDKLEKGSEIYDYPGEFETPAEGERYAKLRRESLESFQEIYVGTTENRSIASGFRFNLSDPDGILHSDCVREYAISEVILRGVVESSESGGAGNHFSCGFKSIPATRQFRAPRSTPKPIIVGPQTARVTGPAGEEIHCDEHGRVKVKFHWDRHGPQDDKSSCWVRVHQGQAGPGRGNIYVPRINDEVIVEFLEGDPDRPLITGSVYNGTNKPPFPLPGGRMKMGFKSLTTPGGGGFNEISLDDSGGKELINIHAQYDMTTTVQHDQTDTINNNRTTTVAVDDKETIQGKQEISVTGDQKVKVGGAQTIEVTGNIKETGSADFAQNIAANSKTEIGANGELKTGANYKTSAGANSEHSATANYKITAGAQCEVSATIIKLSAGGSTIEIGPSGVTITGAMIKVSAMGITDIKGAMVKINS